MKKIYLKTIHKLFIKNPIVSDECEISPFYAINILRNKNHRVMEILQDDNKIDFIDYRAYETIMLDENTIVNFVYDNHMKFWHIDFKTATASHDYVIAKKDNTIFEYIKRPQMYDKNYDYLEW